jgi:hypothetical protein
MVEEGLVAARPAQFGGVLAHGVSIKVRVAGRHGIGPALKPAEPRPKRESAAPSGAPRITPQAGLSCGRPDEPTKT